MADHTFAICAYKESPYLNDCIESVLNQSVKSEVYISTSTDNDHIRNLAAKYNIPVIVNDHEPDIARDWNSAIEAADTKYVTIAHQDDIYEKLYTSAVLKELEEAKNPIICCTDYYEIRNGERVSKNTNLIIKRLLSMPICNTALRGTRAGKRLPLAFGNGICCPSVTYVKDKMPKPLFKEGMLSNLDWQTWEKLSNEEGSFCYVHMLLMGHRIHEESTTTEIIESTSRWQEDYEMFSKFWPSPVAKMLCNMYSKSEASNKIEDK